MSTTEAEHKEVARRISEEVFDEGNLDLVDEFFADDFVGHSATAPEDLHGPEEYKEFVAMTRSAFPDVESTSEDLVAEGDRVVERHVARGTHQGEFMGIEPTGTEVEVEGITILRFEDGAVAESWDIADLFGRMQQLGVVDTPGT